MKPVMIGAIVAAAIVAAFAIGMIMDEETDGPIEQLGETIDDKTGN